MTKIHKGDFGYDDVGGLKELCDNNYKLLFRVAPESERIHPTFWYGIIFAASAIILRICYELEESNALMGFLNMGIGSPAELRQHRINAKTALYSGCRIKTVDKL